jgi:hypothetical protein
LRSLIGVFVRQCLLSQHVVVSKQFVLVHEKVPKEKELATSLVQPEEATAHDKVPPGKRLAPV